LGWSFDASWHTGLMNLESTVATPGETRQALTQLSGRGYTQIRHVFVQLPDGEQRASVLARFLTERKHRALLLYLLLLTCWPWLEERRNPLEAGVWIRALQSEHHKDALTWSASTLSRAWNDLEKMNLISREREGRLLRVTPRREDAGDDYEAPGGRKDRWNAYFSLPDDFWHEELFAQLRLPALVMLLVVAKETNYQSEVWLPYEHMKNWYGISAKSAQNGLKELERVGILHRRTEKIKAPLSPTGSTVRMWYSLTGSYGYESRQALQKIAATETRKRQRAKSKQVAFKAGRKKKK